MNNRYLISAIGMPEDQCRIIQNELNNNDLEQHVWVFNKPVDSDYISRDSYQKFIISIEGMPTTQIAKIQAEMEDANNPQRYWVVNKATKIVHLGHGTK